MRGADGRSGRLSDSDVRQRVHDIVRRRMTGDVTGMLRHFFEDVELNYNCSKFGLFPAGHWRGREALRENLRRTDIEYEPLDFEISAVLVEGDRAAVRWVSNWRARSNCREYKMDMAHFLRWQNGLVVEMDEFLDHHCVSRATDVLPQSFDEMLAPRLAGATRDEIVGHLSGMGNFSARGPDIPFFRSICSPDVVSEFVGDRQTISYAGRHRGIDALANIIRAIGVEFEQLGHTKSNVVIVDGAEAAMRRTVEWRHRGTGRRGLVELADFVRYRDGKIVELIEFRDSVALLQMRD